MLATITSICKNRRELAKE